MKKIVSIRYKMIISILLCIVFLSLAISLILGFQIQSSTLKSYNQFIEQQFFGINKTLFVFESNNQKIVETLSKQRLLKISNSSNVANIYNQNGLQGLDEEGLAHHRSLQNIFSSLREAYPEVVDVYMGSSSGGFVGWDDAEDMRGIDPRSRPWYQAAIKAPDSVVLTEAYMSATKELVVTFAKVIKDMKNREIVGVVGVDISLINLKKFMDKARVGETGYCILLENNGTILVDAKHENVIFKKLEDCGIPCLCKIERCKQCSF